ncbi:MAG TPA: Gfo/Idh/MocA family oxidoreductase [Steroidobacteraceae bacterium]
MNTVSVGIVGAGEITRKFHLPVLVNMADVEIAWIYDQRPEPVRTLAQAYGRPGLHSLAPEKLPKCDVILLAIPVTARSEYLEWMCLRGVAALCEKPFAMSRAEHERLIKLFAPHALGAGYMRRYFGSTMLLRQIVSDRTFGGLRRIDIGEGNRSKGSGVDSSFLDDARLGHASGVLADLGSHSIDLALHVSAATGFEVQSCEKVLDGVIDRKVTAAVSLRTVDQELAPIELNYGVSWLDRQENQIRLTFEHAQVWSSLLPSAEVFVGDPDSPQSAIRLTSAIPGASNYNQAFYLQWRDFLTCFRDKQESSISARRALLTTSLVEALLSEGDSTHA